MQSLKKLALALLVALRKLHQPTFEASTSPSRDIKTTHVMVDEIKLV